MERMICVTKTATATVAANIVRLRITVRGTGKTSEDAIAKCDNVCCAVTEALSNKVPVSGGGMNVSAVRTDKKVTGYNAVRTLSSQFDYDGDLLSSALDCLAAFDAEWNVSFTASDANARKELLRVAVEEAHEVAQEIAAAAGVKIGRLIKAEYANVGGAAPVMLRAAHFGGDIDPEDITVSETVECAWEIE